MAEIELAGTAYQCNRISPARRSFHVVRRLMPAADHFVPLFMAQNQGEIVPAAAWFQAFFRGIPELDDAAWDYIIEHSLAFVRFRSGDRWAPLMAPNGGGIMLDSADRLDIQGRLVFEVLRETTEDFSLDLLLGLTQPNGSLPMAMPQAA